MYTKLEEQVIQLLRKGYSYFEIEDQLNVNNSTITKVMKKLEENRDYNTLKQIFMERSLRREPIVKDYLEFFEEGILKGKTSLELSYELEHSKEYKGNNGEDLIYTDKDIKDYLRDMLKNNASVYKNPKYYEELIIQLKNNDKMWGLIRYIDYKDRNIDVKKYLSKTMIKQYEDEINQRRLAKEIKSLPKDMGISEMAIKYSLSSDKVSEILRGEDSEQLLAQYHGEEEAQKMVQQYPERLALLRKKNLEAVQLYEDKTSVSEIDKKRREFLYANQDVILRMILHYRLPFESLQKLLSFDNPDYLREEINRIASVQIDGFTLSNTIPYVLFGYLQDRYPNKEEQLEKKNDFYRQASNFWKKYLKAKKDNSDELNHLLSDLYDFKYRVLLKKGVFNFTKLSKEDQRTVIEYRLKYFIPHDKFPFNLDAMFKNCPEDLKMEWKVVSDQNRYISIKNLINKNKSWEPKL